MKTLFLVFAFAGFLFAQVDSTQTLGVESVVKVYDGDTFYANLFSIPAIFGKDIGIRLIGIDTPELKGSDSCNTALAKAAKAYMEKRLLSACKIVLKNISRDKYFRLDCVVFVDGVNLNNEMIEKGYAKPYTGEGSKPVFTCKK